MALLSAFEAGDLAEARRLHHRLFPLCRDLLSVAVNPIPVKALGLLGRVSDEMRLPLSSLDDAGRAAVPRPSSGSD